MLYQHTPEASKGNAFAWCDGKRSVFLGDPIFKAPGTKGVPKGAKAGAEQAAAVLKTRWNCEHGKPGRPA